MNRATNRLRELLDKVDEIIAYLVTEHNYVVERVSMVSGDFAITLTHPDYNYPAVSASDLLHSHPSYLTNTVIIEPYSDYILTIGR